MELTTLDSTVSNSSALNINVQKGYKWRPKEDITAYELALCIPVFGYQGGWNIIDYIEKLPPQVLRHFVKIK
jgi:hypothetical protein